MIKIGVQTKNIINGDYPKEDFAMLRKVGFTCADFNLNEYLSNELLYQYELNSFFDQSVSELEHFFAPYKQGAAAAGICINQMHMPYPVYVPGAPEALNEYLTKVVALKSMELCAYFDCPYIVVHGFKLARLLGSEQAEWERTEAFLKTLVPMAKEFHITICIENLYTSCGGHIVEGPCCNAVRAVSRIDRMNAEVGAEVFGFCFDTGHANLIGLDFEDFITTLGSRIKVLHIHDNDGIEDLHQIPFTFTKGRENRTSTDWNGFITGLGKIGYDGVLSFETAPALSAFPGRMRQEVLSFIAGIGEYFAREISEKTC